MTAMKNLICAGVILTIAFSAAADTETPRKEHLLSMALSSNDFGLDLYRQLAAGKTGNLFCSPSSIHTALTMTFAGARGNTEDQMAGVLHLPRFGAVAMGPEAVEKLKRRSQQHVHHSYTRFLNQLQPGKDAGYQLSVANALWGQKGAKWLPEFLKIQKNNYGAPLQEVDFKTATEDARKTINGWVEDKTKDKIKDLLQPGVLTGATRLVLTNAIYFKGFWATQFKKSRTREMPFKLGGGKTVKAPMMFQNHTFGYAADDSVQVLSMPYRGKDLSMLVVLPKKVDGLKDVEGKLSAKQLDGWVGRLRQRKVDVYLPRYKMTSQFSLNNVLTKMGMADAFDPNKADLSGMSGSRNLFISAVVHKAFVDVNEEGTEAAAATAVVIALKSAPAMPLIFRADHPFLFLIRHNNSGAILFLGRVMNPKA